MTSSASKPSLRITVMPRPARSSSISPIWLLKSSGEAERLALYSGNFSVRNVWRDTSKATATCVGRSSRSVLISIDVNPCTAPVGCPVVVRRSASFSA